jgi:hypothetical protein
MWVDSREHGSDGYTWELSHRVRRTSSLRFEIRRTPSKKLSSFRFDEPQIRTPRRTPRQIRTSRRIRTSKRTSRRIRTSRRTSKRIQSEIAQNCSSFSSFSSSILSQTSSAFACERNFSSFNYIQSKKINKLLCTRLEDLVYVRSNLKLALRSVAKDASSSSRPWFGPTSPCSLDDLELYDVTSRPQVGHKNINYEHVLNFVKQFEGL